jgi:hypothetical protein
MPLLFPWYFRKEVVFVVALVAAFGWHWNDKRKGINEAVAEVHGQYAAAAAEANAEARQLEQRRASVAQGISDALVRDKKRAAAAAARAGDELNRLRLAIDEASLHTPQHAEDSRGIDAAGAGRALGECGATAKALAEDGDAMARKLARLQEIAGMCVAP